MARHPAPMHMLPPQEFDAFIDLSHQDLPPGMEPEAAVAVVRDALCTLPGAGRISVSYWGDTLVLPSPIVKVWSRGQTNAQANTNWLSIIIRRACRAALAAAEPDA